MIEQEKNVEDGFGKCRSESMDESNWILRKGEKNESSMSAF